MQTAPLTASRSRTLLWAAAMIWLSALGALLLLFARVGEGAWQVVLLLYLPRHLWLLPGLLLIWPAAQRGRRWLLLPLGAGFLLWLFPIMGFVPPHPTGRAGGPRVRVLSFNTSHGVDGVDGLRALVLQARADIALFQWSSHLVDEALSGPGFEGWSVRRGGQFTVATRYPLRSMDLVGLPSGSGPPCAHAVEPPVNAPLASTSTLWCSAKVSAAVSPAAPDPMMMTSGISVTCNSVCPRPRSP